MKKQTRIRIMRILIKMIDSARVKGAGAADKTVDFVTL